MASNSGIAGRIDQALASVYERYVNAVCANPRRAAALLVLVCLPALALSIEFFGHIEAGLQELLPPSAPSVRALTQLHELVGGRAHLSIIAQSPDRAANERFITELCARLENDHLPEIRSIQANVNPERQWLLGRGLMLMPRADFDALMKKVDAAIGEMKKTVDPLNLGIDDEKKPTVDWADIERQVDEAVHKHDRFPTGFIESADGNTVVALIWMAGSEVDIGPPTRLLDAVKRNVDALRPGFPAALTVAYNGEVPNLVEEHAAILADISTSTAFVVLLVGACIAIYFRSMRAVLTVVLALVPGLLFTFALGRLTVGGLNSNTAFLGTIIAGNGINYPLLMLAYYRAQPSGHTMPHSITAAARSALPGTLGAAMTASAAYGGLAVSDFRGFSQFGWIGGIGMLTVWVFSFVALPVVVAVFNPPRRVAASTSIQDAAHRFFAQKQLVNVVALGFTALALAWAGLGVLRAKRSGIYEMDLQVLRNRESLTHGSASWDPKMNEVFGVWLNPVVALAVDPAQREPAAAELRRAFETEAPGGVEAVDTIEKYVPPDADQQARLPQIQHVAHEVHLTDPQKIPAGLKANFDLWFAPANMKPIIVADVPQTLKQSFAETSGRVDRIALIYPSLHVNYNDGHNILHFADVLHDARLPPDVIVGGGFLFMAEILRLVRDQALRVVLVVCALVGALLVALYWRRPLRAVVSLVSMVAVAFCSQAAVVALGIRINLLNFAALPITVGVGADYVVNLFGAMTSLRVDARSACARMGGAIVLCSLTTTIGYLSLVLAQSGALRSFGWAAVLGELMAVVTVLLVLPAVIGEHLPNPPELIPGSDP